MREMLESLGVALAPKHKWNGSRVKKCSVCGCQKYSIVRQSNNPMRPIYDTMYSLGGVVYNTAPDCCKTIEDDKQFIAFCGTGKRWYLAVKIQADWATFKIRYIAGQGYLDYKLIALDEWGYIKLPEGRHGLIGLVRDHFVQHAAIHRLMDLKTPKASYDEFNRLGLNNDYLILKIENR